MLSTRGLLNGSLPGNYGENGVLGEVCPETMINNFFAPDFQPGHKLVAVWNACHAALNRQEITMYLAEMFGTFTPHFSCEAAGN